MSRKVILFFVLVIIIISGIFLYFRFINNGNNTTKETATKILRGILPFGSSPQSNNVNTLLNNTEIPLIIGDNPDTTKPIVRLRHYTFEPTAGSTIVLREKDVIKDRVKVRELGYYVRYVDRATGHIFETRTTEEKGVKISNTTIPKIHEATFLPSGSSLIVRFLDKNEQISTYYITLKDKILDTQPKTSTSTLTVGAKNVEEKNILKDLSGVYLSTDIKQIAISPSGSRILESFYGIDGGILSMLENSKLKTVLTHPLREWLIDFPLENKAILTTKPSGVSFGYSFVLDVNTGLLKRVLGGIIGLTVLPNPDLNTYLISEGGSDIKLYVYNDTSKTTKNVSLKTLPEKCVWGNKATKILLCAVPQSIPSALYPDDWYKGKVSFSDSIWRINLDTGETNLISNLSEEGGQAIDAVNLRLSSDGKYITFINKIDLTLWGLDLNTDDKNTLVVKAPEETKLCAAKLFLTNPVKLGARNNPEDVKLLETFLNQYENTYLSVNGVYEKEDFDAVVKWQEKYKEDILTPWGLNKGTGYVYSTSLEKIKEIVGKC